MELCRCSGSKGGLNGGESVGVIIVYSTTKLEGAYYGVGGAGTVRRMGRWEWRRVRIGRRWLWRRR